MAFECGTDGLGVGASKRVGEASWSRSGGENSGCDVFGFSLTLWLFFLVPYHTFSTRKMCVIQQRYWSVSHKPKAKLGTALMCAFIFAVCCDVTMRLLTRDVL